MSEKDEKEIKQNTTENEIDKEREKENVKETTDSQSNSHVKKTSLIIVSIGILVIIISAIFVFARMADNSDEASTSNTSSNNTEQETVNKSTGTVETTKKPNEEAPKQEDTTKDKSDEKIKAPSVIDTSKDLSEEEYLNMVRESLMKEKDYAKVMSLAEFKDYMVKEGKNREVFVYYFSPVCGYCIDTTPKLMEGYNEALKTKKDIVLIQLDVTDMNGMENGILFDIGDIQGTPTLTRVVNGKEVSRISGGGMPTEFFADYLGGSQASYFTNPKDNSVIDNTVENNILDKLQKLQFVK